jgi:hypothetical protein
MTQGIETHVARANRRRHTLDDVILVWAVLMNHCQAAVRIRGEGIAGGRVVSRESMASVRGNRSSMGTVVMEIGFGNRTSLPMPGANTGAPQ